MNKNEIHRTALAFVFGCIFWMLFVIDVSLGAAFAFAIAYAAGKEISDAIHDS